MKAKWLILVGLLLLTACNQRQTNVVVPTLIPSATVAPATAAPTASPIVLATLPPTWTPAISDTPSSTPTPTLTPSLTPTPTQTYTPTPNETNAALLSQPLPAICANFAADPARNMTQFPLDTAPTVAWTPVDTAANYILRVYDENNVTIFTQTLTDTEVTLKADLFAGNQSYAWDVAPLDANGGQLCPSRGALLVPSP